MTVTELLARILDAYPGATPEAMATFKPVFYARLKRHEGTALEGAANEVFGSFKAKYDQKFPIPADFDMHLPKGHPHINQGPAIRGQLDARTARVARLYATWLAEQGYKIRAARHPNIYGACVLYVMELCRRADDRTARVVLSPEQYRECEMRALSSERAHRWRPARSNEAWQAQIEEIRAEWAQPKAEAA